MIIKLFCAQGMSTSLLVEKMKEEAKKQGINVEINAYSVNSLDEELKNCDVALIGPQISYMYDEIKSKASKNEVKIEKISMIDYGMMNGKNVLNMALKL